MEPIKPCLSIFRTPIDLKLENGNKKRQKNERNVGYLRILIVSPQNTPSHGHRTLGIECKDVIGASRVQFFTSQTATVLIAVMPTKH